MDRFHSILSGSPLGSGSRPTSARLLWAALVPLFGSVPAASAHGQAAAADSIQFAGVAYLARADEIATRFPVFEAIRARAGTDGAGRYKINQALLVALQQAGLPLRTDLATEYGLTMSFALDDEYRILQRVDEGYKVVTGISGQLLTYDARPTEQVAVSAFPVTYEYTDLVSAPPGPRYAADVAAQISNDFLRSDSAGVFPQAAAALRALPQTRESRCKVRIAPFTYDSMTRRAGQQQFGTAESRMADALRNLVQRQFITSAQLPLLPNGDSRARTEMLQRFASGEVFLLKIPEPDFELVFSDLRTRQMVAGRSASRRIDATGVQVQVAVRAISPIDSAIQVQGTYRHIVNDTVPANQAAGDPWPGVAAAVTRLTNSLARSMRTKDKEWFKKNDVVGSTFPALSNWLHACAP